jgi:type I restriction enzyme M protein
MNMILHDVHYQKFDLRQADTLEDPQHEGQVFEAIVANPPFSAKWSADPLKLNDPRYSIYGKLAPKTKADYAFVTHMIHHLDDNGTMAVVVPHGVLFRGAAEGHIREFIVNEKNWLDAVIGLPANIFFGTGIPTCIMVFKKNRDSDSVLFIDASEGFEKVGNQNVLREQHINHIVEVYRERKVEDKFSYEATSQELSENEFNLNIPRYVDNFEEEEPVDLEAVSNELEALEGEISETDKTIEDFCKELNIKPPF